MYNINVGRILANKNKICTESATNIIPKERTKEERLEDVCAKYNPSIKINEVNFNSLTESTLEERQFQFEYQAIDLFYNENEDITLEAYQSFITNAMALLSNEVVMEGPADVTRKLANKVATGVRRIDQTSSGKGRSVKKNLDRIDKSLSSLVNKKIDDIINTGRDNKREKIITGRVSVKISKLLRNTIKTLTGATAARILLGPVAGTIATMVGLLAAYACSKNTEVREKKRILLDLETELKIVKEKIEDAKGENDKKQKYELMRTQATLEKEITRIKYNLRHY